jgi:hypothetical protein
MSVKLLPAWLGRCQSNRLTARSASAWIASAPLKANSVGDKAA